MQDRRMPEQKRESSAEYYGVISAEKDGYKLYSKDDGFDYTALWDAFRKGQLESVETLAIRDFGKREVYSLQAWGRKYILKIDREVSRHLEVRIWRALQGPFHSRQMKIINRAVNNGCTVTPEIYFTAEKMQGRLALETYTIQEFVEGRMLCAEKDYKPFYPAIAAAVEELHKHGLVFSDPNDSNIMLTDNGIKLIDLSWKGMTWAGKGKDVVVLRELYGLELPERNFSRWLASKYITIKHALRDFIQGKG